MEVALLIARLFLAGIFGVAGVAKATDRESIRRTMIAFGAPNWLTTPSSWALPYAEILVALALLPAVSAWWGGVGALVLLLIFTAAIGVTLARGQAPDCNCFGSLHSEPVRWRTVARNLALVVVAGFIVFAGKDDPGLSAVGWLADLQAAAIVNLLIGGAGLGLLIVAITFLRRLLKQQSGILDQIRIIKTALELEGLIEEPPIVRREAAAPEEGLPIGAFAPKFSLPAVSGGVTSLDLLLERGKPLLLLFASPNCWGCKLLLPAVRVWQRDLAEQLTVAVLNKGTPTEGRTMLAKYEINNLLLDEKSEAADDYRVRWTPAALLINSDGKIASQLSFGDNLIREWFRNLVSSGQLRPEGPNGNTVNGRTLQTLQVALRYSVKEIGEPTPRFALHDLSGNVVSVEDLKGSPTLLFFWHPRCQYCKLMSDDLKRWERQPAPNAPKLVFISTGEEEDVRAVNTNFKSLTLLDPAFDIAPQFGTKFTPSAIILDEHGRIASSLAIGDQNVRALVGLPEADKEKLERLIYV